jgi:hypothetical protein
MEDFILPTNPQMPDSRYFPHSRENKKPVPPASACDLQGERILLA